MINHVSFLSLLTLAILKGGGGVGGGVCVRGSIPAKHIKPIAIRPVVIMVIPKPSKDSGIFEYVNFSLIDSH